MKTTLLKSRRRLKGRISKKLSQEFSKRESRILGALAKLDHFLTSSVNSACISTPKAKLTSVTGNQDLSPSDYQDREGHSLNGQQDRNRISDPDEVVHTEPFKLSVRVFEDGPPVL